VTQQVTELLLQRGWLQTARRSGGAKSVIHQYSAAAAARCTRDRAQSGFCGSGHQTPQGSVAVQSREPGLAMEPDRIAK